MQVSRSPFKIRENLRRLLTHLRIKTVDTPEYMKIGNSPVEDLLRWLLGFLDVLEASHAKLNGNLVVHFQCHKFVLL